MPANRSKLTKPMRRVLESIQSGNKLIYSYADGWILANEYDERLSYVHSNTVLALELRGWIGEKKITPAGRKALKESNHG